MSGVCHDVHMEVKMIKRILLFHRLLTCTHILEILSIMHMYEILT